MQFVSYQQSQGAAGRLLLSQCWRHRIEAPAHDVTWSALRVVTWTSALQWSVLSGSREIDYATFRQWLIVPGRGTEVYWLPQAGNCVGSNRG